MAALFQSTCLLLYLWFNSNVLLYSVLFYTTPAISSSNRTALCLFCWCQTAHFANSSAYFKYILFDAEHKHPSSVFLCLSDTAPTFSKHTLNQNISAALVLSAPKLYPPTTARVAFVPDSRVGTLVRMRSTFVAAN